MVVPFLLLSLLIGLGGSQVQCPVGYTAPTSALYTGFCYKYTTASMTWGAHEQECARTAGGHLATVFNQKSASVVMNNYCNNLNQGQAHYFIGYYCISTSYTSRSDWRWTSGLPTTWIHSNSVYLSGGEPDDFGCGRAHYSDDGAITGRIGDWRCSTPLYGGCCEAPVIPTPTSTRTATQTATQTATVTITRTRTRTQTSTPTATLTASTTSTRTGTVTVTKTSTATNTVTKTSSTTETSTASATKTATATASASTSQTTSASMSASPSTSISASASVTTSASMSASASVSVQRPVIGGVDGVVGGAETAAGQTSESANGATAVDDTNNMPVVIGSSIAGGLLLMFGLCALWVIFLVRNRRRERRAKQAAAARVLRNGLQRRPAADVASTMGVSSASHNTLFRSLNPALLTAMASSSDGVNKAARTARMTLALSAYKNTSAFKPVGIHTVSETARLTAAPQMTEDADLCAIGVADDDVATAAENDIDINAVEDADAEDDVADDEEDLEESLANAAPAKHRGMFVTKGAHTAIKTKYTTESALAPPVENHKLVIGKGSLLEEQVQKQTVQLRRVSKVKGDRDLTAQRTQSIDRYARPSAIQSYAFTATVSRTLVKK